MPSYKLIYFDIKGKGETTRLAFTLGGIPFEDHRVSFEAWPALKPKIPSGQLPALEVDGKMIGESTAIFRLAAREAGLLGSNNFEQAQIESITDTIDVLFNHVVRFKFYPDESVKASLKKDLSEKQIPSTISLLEKHLGDKEYFVLDKLTLAELHFYSVFGNLKEYADCDWHVLSPKLKALYDRVEKNPKIAAYLAKQK